MEPAPPLPLLVQNSSAMPSNAIRVGCACAVAMAEGEHVPVVLHVQTVET